MKFLTNLVLVSVLVLGASSINALTEEQSDEFYSNGVITTYDDDGNKTGHFEVSFMPGADNIVKSAKQRWDEAASTMSELLKEKKFWRKKVLSRFKAGLRYMEAGVEDGIFQIDDDFIATLKENKKTRGQFGHLGSVLKGWLGFGARTAGNILETIWGIGAGAVYAVAAPTGTILWRPIKASTTAIAAGTLWPAMKYSWNGVAYIATNHLDQPEAGDMTVTFVPEKIDEDGDDEDSDDDLSEL